MPSRHGGGKPTRQERVVLPIAQRLLSMYCAQVIESVVWIFRAGDGWSFGKAAVDREVVRMDPTTTTRDRKEVYDLLLNMSPRGAFADARYVAFANGDLDVETLSLMPRSPQRVVPCPLPWGWDPSARSTRVAREVRARLPARRARQEGGRHREQRQVHARRGRLPPRGRRERNHHERKPVRAAVPH